MSADAKQIMKMSMELARLMQRRVRAGAKIRELDEAIRVKRKLLHDLMAPEVLAVEQLAPPPASPEQQVGAFCRAALTDCAP